MNAKRESNEKSYDGFQFPEINIPPMENPDSGSPDADTRAEPAGSSPNIVERTINAVQNFISPPTVDWKLVTGLLCLIFGTFLFDYRACLILIGVVALVWYFAVEEQ